MKFPDFIATTRLLSLMAVISIPSIRRASAEERLSENPETRSISNANEDAAVSELHTGECHYQLNLNPLLACPRGDRVVAVTAFQRLSQPNTDIHCVSPL
jgi:hypothetical protein